MPGDYVEQKFTLNPNSEISPERIYEMKELYGLNDSIIVGYAKWLWKALQGDFGMSFQFDAPVMDIIGKYMWISFLLTLIALLLYYPLGIFLGVRAAVKQYSIFDYTTTVITMLGISLPSFFFSAVLIKIFAFDLGWFDTSLGLVSSGVLNPTKWEEFWFITFPMLSRITLLVGVFTMVELFTNERNPLIAEVYKKIRGTQYDESSAMIWFYFIIVAAIMGIVMFLFNKFIMKRYEA